MTNGSRWQPRAVLNLHRVRTMKPIYTAAVPLSSGDPTDRLSAQEYAALLEAMAGRPTRRRSRTALSLSLAEVLVAVRESLAAYPDHEAAA
jgi:hypothetical protein